MRMNWFSPLPPAATAASEWTVGLLPHLQTRAEVVLWTCQPTWDRKLQKRAAIRHLGPDRLAWADLNRADVNVYHLGNDPELHGAIWDVSCRHPGVVVLHEAQLHELIYGYCREHHTDRLRYLLLMQQYYGHGGLRHADSYWEGRLTTEFMARRYPLTAAGVQNALGVLVSSRSLFDWLRRENHSAVALATPSAARADAVTALWELVDNAPQARSGILAERLTRRAAEELSVWLTAEKSEQGLRRLAEVIRVFATEMQPRLAEAKQGRAA